jgi:hypothetical protein
VADDDPNDNEDQGQAGGNGNGDSSVPAEQGSPARPSEEPQREVLSLSQLIGAPIHALVDAEAQSAMATARFIRNVGFKPPEDGDLGDLGDLQMARFKSTRRGEDGEEEDFEVQIPLLTLLPIPALQIQDAELEYYVKVIQTETLPEQRGWIHRSSATP